MFEAHLLILNFLNENLSITDFITLTSEQDCKLFCNFLSKGFPELRDFLILHCVKTVSLCTLMLGSDHASASHFAHTGLYLVCLPAPCYILLLHTQHSFHSF